MTIHRLTSNIVFFALGLNIALASASAKLPDADDCGSALGCIHQEEHIKRIKISRPVRFSDEQAEHTSVHIETKRP